MGRKKREKITKDMVPEGFTLSLAIVDAIPVLLFAVAVIILGMKAAFSPLIIIGGAVMFAAGALKVLWKMLVAVKHKNVYWMYRQMAPVMGLGGLLLLIGCIVSHTALGTAFAGIGAASIVFFALWFVSMVLMSIFAVKLDSSDPKSNWAEQCTNGIGQFCLCLALAML